MKNLTRPVSTVLTPALRALLALLVSASAVACGGAGAPAAPSPPSSAASSAPASTGSSAAASSASSSQVQPAKANYAGVTVVGESWGGFWTDGTQGVFCGALTTATGAKCQVGSGSSLGMVSKVIAQKDNPQMDFLFVDDALVPELIANGAIQKIDFSKIPNAGGYFKRVQSQIDQFKDYYLPIGIQEVGIGYRADLLKQNNLPEPTKWADLWDPVYKGKLMLVAWNYNFAWGFLEAAAAVRCNNPKDLECGYQEIKKLHDSGQLAMTVDSMTNLEKNFTDGSALLGLTSNGRIFGLQDKGVDVKFVNPGDYAMTNSWGVAAVRKLNDQQWNALMSLFNEMTSPRNQASFMEKVPYGPSTVQARDFMDSKALARLKTTDSALEPLKWPDWDGMRKVRPAFTEKFNREIAR